MTPYNVFGSCLTQIIALLLFCSFAPESSFFAFTTSVSPPFPCKHLSMKHIPQHVSCCKWNCPFSAPFFFIRQTCCKLWKGSEEYRFRHTCRAFHGMQSKARVHEYTGSTLSRTAMLSNPSLAVNFVVNDRGEPESSDAPEFMYHSDDILTGMCRGDVRVLVEGMQSHFILSTLILKYFKDLWHKEGTVFACVRAEG